MIGYVHYMAADSNQKSAAAPARIGEGDTGSRRLKNPIAYTAQSIARGKLLYRSSCVDCHSFDGTGRESDVTDNATDLTDLSQVGLRWKRYRDLPRDSRRLRR